MSKSEEPAGVRKLADRTLLVVKAIVVVGAVIACSVFTFVEVSAVKSDMKSLQQHINMTSIDAFSGMFQLQVSLSQVNETLLNLSLLQKSITQELNHLKNLGQSITFPAASCAIILLFAPSIPSGYYWIMSSKGSAVYVYCDMTRPCGNITGGWMRVAELDMRDKTTQCPCNLMLKSEDNSHICISKSIEAACT